MGRLVVVPDSDRLEQWLLDEAREAELVDLRGACTLAQLLERAEAGRATTLVPAEPLLVRLVFGREAPTHARAAFGDVALSPEFAAQAQEVIGHLRSQAASWRDLERAAAGADERLGPRARALAALWRAVDEALAKLGFVDRGDWWRLAAEALEAKGLPPGLAGYEALEVRHLHDLPRARLRFLRALAAACQRAGVAFTWRWPSSGEGATDAFVVSAVREVEGAWQGLDAQVEAELPDAPLAWVGAQAFADEPRRQRAPGLFAFSAPSAREEAREIARRVRQFVVAGVPPEAIAVVFRDLAEDSEAVVEALADQGIAARARLGVPLAQSPLGCLALSLLELADDGFPADGVATVLDHRAVQLLPREAAPPRRTFREAGARDAELGASGEQDAYAVRLGAFAARAGAERRAVELLAEGVLRLLELCRAVPGEAPARELLDAWWDALTKLGALGAPRRPEAHGGRLFTAEVDRALARDQAAVDALMQLLSSLRDALRASGLSGTRLTRRAFARWVRLAAGDLNLVARGARAGAVWLLDARETAGRRFAHVFLGGLVDGRFPGRAPPLPVFTEEERGALNRLAGKPLFRASAGEGDVRLGVRLAEDRLLFHLALCAGDAVTVSRARTDDAGRELLASPFRDALARCVEGFREVTVGRAPVPGFDAVQTEDELRVRAALEGLGPLATRQTEPDERRAGVAPVLGAEPWFREAAQHAAAEAERLRFFSAEGTPSGPFSGRVEGAALEALQPRLRFDAAHPVSAGELDKWGTCAFRGLASRVLGFEQEETATEDLDVRVAGDFWHDALAQVVPVLDEDGLLGRDSPGLLARVEEAVAAAATRIEQKKAVGHPLLWRLGQRRARALVHRLVRAPAVLPFPGARPRYIEADFGTAKAPDALREVRVPAALPGEEDVYLQGRLDRVDVGAGAVGVLDYKSSLPKGLKETFLRSNFQMAAYLLAVRALVPGRTPQAAWLAVRSNESQTLDKAVGRDGVVEEVLALDAQTRARLAEDGLPNLANAVHGLLGRLRAGDFGARPVDCRFCDFSALCRISERRLPEDGP
jgi:hypothetical protein